MGEGAPQGLHPTDADCKGRIMAWIWEDLGVDMGGSWRGKL